MPGSPACKTPCMHKPPACKTQACREPTSLAVYQSLNGIRHTGLGSLKVQGPSSWASTGQPELLGSMGLQSTGGSTRKVCRSDPD